MIEILNYREKYYVLGRIIAVFIISPLLIIRGKKYNDKLLILIGFAIFLWDGFKLLYG